MQSTTIRAARLALAYFISFIYIYAVNASDGVWIFIICTLILINSATVGSTLLKAYRRLKGNFFVFIFAFIWIQLFSNNDVANFIGLAIGVMAAVYYFFDTPDIDVGGFFILTLPLLLLNNNNLNILFMRASNITIGLIIVFILQRFFYPDYARLNLLKKMKHSLNSIQLLLEDFINPFMCKIWYHTHHLNISNDSISILQKENHCFGNI